MIWLGEQIRLLFFLRGWVQENRDLGSLDGRRLSVNVISIGRGWDACDTGDARGRGLDGRCDVDG